MFFRNKINRCVCIALASVLAIQPFTINTYAAIATPDSDTNVYSFEQSVAQTNEIMLRMNRKWEEIKEQYPIGSEEKNSLEFASKVYKFLFGTTIPDSVNKEEAYKFDSYGAYNLKILGQIADTENVKVTSEGVAKLLSGVKSGDIIQTARYKSGTDIYACHTMIVESILGDEITVYHAGLSGTVAESVYDIYSFADSFVCGSDKGSGVGITIYRNNEEDNCINAVEEDKFLLNNTVDSDKSEEKEIQFYEETIHSDINIIDDEVNDTIVEDDNLETTEESEIVEDSVESDDSEDESDANNNEMQNDSVIEETDNYDNDNEASDVNDETFDVFEQVKEVYEDAYMYDDDTICYTIDDGEKIYADKDDPEILGHFMEDIHEDADDVLASEFYANGTATVSPFTSKSYVHDAKFEAYNVLNGIDVSRHNGTIDWAKAKKGGVDFAFIRIGYRGYGAEGNIPAAGDDKGAANVRAAYNAGVKVGVYFFSQAISVAEGKEEAEFCLNYIKKNNLAKYISLPVIIDYEYYESAKGRLYDAKLNAAEHQAVCDSFANTIHNGGFTPGVYANYSMLKDDMHPSRSADYTKYWVARWNTATYYTGNYNFWQYSATGKVPGISGDVDCDFYYEVKGQTKPEEKPSNITYSLHAPTKTTYSLGEKINLAGAYLLSSNGEKISITNTMISGFSSDKPGVKTVNVNYGGKIYSFDVLVHDIYFAFDTTYGNKLKGLQLPEVSYGKLTWKKNENTSVGAVGKNKFYVIFTPSDSRFSKCEYYTFVTVKHSIGDGINETADVTVAYNEQIVANNSRDMKVLNSVRHKVALKKDVDYTFELVTDSVYDADGNLVDSGEVIESGMVPKGYTGTFKLVINAKGNYLGGIEKNIYVTEKSKLLKNVSISLGSNLKNINFVDFDESLFIPAVYDKTTKNYYMVENGEISDRILTKEEIKQAFTVKLGNQYLIMGKDFEIASFGGGYVGNQYLTLNGINGYLGIKKVLFKIKGKTLTTKNITVTGIENRIYDGSAKYNEDIVVTFKENANATEIILVKDKDYAITYSDNTNPGTAKMTITGLAANGYSGKVNKTFKILAK